MLPDDRRLFVLVALRPACRAPENDFISFRPKSRRFTPCKMPGHIDGCSMPNEKITAYILLERSEEILMSGANIFEFAE
jgi:hypothetical protein